VAWFSSLRPVYCLVISVPVLVTLHLQLHLCTRRCQVLPHDVYGTYCVRAGRTDIHARARADDLILAVHEKAPSVFSLNVNIDERRRRKVFSGRRVELTEAM